MKVKYYFFHDASPTQGQVVSGVKSNAHLKVLSNGKHNSGNFMFESDVEIWNHTTSVKIHKKNDFWFQLLQYGN
jgi:hypothetical protein